MLRNALYPYSSSTGRQVASEDECQRSTGGGPGIAGSRGQVSRSCQDIDYLRSVGRVWELPGHDLDLQDPKGELISE